MVWISWCLHLYFTMSNMALFHVNFNFNNKVLWVPVSKILTMAIPEILSTNEALTFINFCSFGFNITLFSGNMGTDQFQNLKQQSLEIITPSNLKHILLYLKLGPTFSMDFRYQCVNFKSMPMYIYDYWYDK